MDTTMTLATQSHWTWWIAIYLYLGGMGAATLSVTFLTDMYLRPHRGLVLWGAFSGVVMLGVGSLLLFIHLLHHGAVIHVLNPLALIHKPDAWIAWGTQFILWMMVWGILYALPRARECDKINTLPLIGWLLDSHLVAGVAGWCGRNCKFVGWVATLNGIGTAVYTGLVLQSFPAVALWHNPGVPLLFTVSAFSTAMANLLLVMNTFMHNDEDHGLRVLYERIDVVLIAIELVILFSFFFFLKSGSESGRKSLELLLGNLGWMVGFIGFGLVVPFLVELKSVTRGCRSQIPIATASVLVLAGGYLLRHYFLAAGVYAYPW